MPCGSLLISLELVSFGWHIILGILAFLCSPAYMAPPREKGPLPTEGALDPSLVAWQSGVWRIITQRRTSRKWIDLQSLWSPFTTRWNDLLELKYLLLFLADVFNFGPGLFIMYGLSQVISGFEDAVKLYYMNSSLKQVERAIATGKADISGIITTFATYLLVSMTASCLFWLHYYTETRLKSRMTVFCRSKVMQAHLSLDLLSSHDSSNVMDTALTSHAYRSLRAILELFTSIASSLSQFLVIFNLMKAQDSGLILLILCLAHPLAWQSMSKGFRRNPGIYYASDRIYRRFLAFWKIATTTEHRQEVISGGLARYITEEFNKGATCAESGDMPSEISGIDRTPFRNCLSVLLNELPLLYYLSAASRRPETLSLTFIATLQQMNQNINWMVIRLSQADTRLWENITRVKVLYENPSDPKVRFKSGDLPFPPGNQVKDEGMHIQLRNVSFKYPGTKEDQVAVRDVSFTIPSSALVVIVGANGSGKSSLVKLLSHLYQPTSGTILIGEHEATAYRVKELHEATALLTQDHTIFPGLPVSENIGIGDPSDVNNMKKIHEAARLGGAHELINKLPRKFDEELSPVQTCAAMRTLSPGPLKKLRDNVERVKDLSGGEKQRLAASRTFMRLFSDKTKLVVVDEPTSAMDPTGEYELFERLRGMRQGKTMVFVTHRFGHLTKHADLILCMKDGVLVESGTHRELMARAGEYSQLYDIQARAFADDAAPGESV